MLKEIYKEILRHAVKWDLVIVERTEPDKRLGKLLEVMDKDIHQNPYSQFEIARKLDELGEYKRAMTLFLFSVVGYKKNGLDEPSEIVASYFRNSMRRENRRGIERHSSKDDAYKETFQYVIEIGELFLETTNTKVQEEIEHEIYAAREWLNTAADGFRRRNRRRKRSRKRRK